MIEREELQGYEIFEGLAPEELQVILGYSSELSLKDGETILEESKEGPDHDLFVIVKGMVKVEIASSETDAESRASKRLAVLKGGDVFGERGFLKGRHRSARVLAYSDVVVLKVDRDRLFELFVHNPRLGYLVMRNLAAILSGRIVEMNFMWRDDI
jgi:CRP/FNR family cyclic AMP-dependent transcriptional regulator